MRALIIGFVIFLAACNGSGNSTPSITHADIQTAIQQDTAQLQERVTKAEAAASKANAALAQIQLFVKIDQSPVTNLAVRALQNAIDFGPCTNAGIKIGSTLKFGGSALDEQTQAFKQTPTDTCPGAYAEYDVLTGNLHTASRVYFANADCTGNPLVWDAGGEGYDGQKLPAGLSFISPLDSLQYWVPPGTIPQTVTAQSNFIVSNGDCELDGDVQPMWEASRTSVIESGIPLTLGASYQLSGL